jgi:hypothetical protein
MNKYDLTQYGILGLFFLIVGTNEVFFVEGVSVYQDLAIICGLLFILTTILEFINKQKQ